jgi:hypothetical protein
LSANLVLTVLPRGTTAGNSNLNWGQAGEEVAVFFRQQGVSAPFVDGAFTIDPTIYIPGAHVWKCDEPDPVSPQWVAVSSYKLTRAKPNCLGLERYPSWNIGGGAVIVFHVINALSSVDSRPDDMFGSR